MSSFKEIRNQIKSVRSTQKITRALHLVAVSKLHQAKEILSHSHPFIATSQSLLYQVLTDKLYQDPDYSHPYLVQKKKERVGLIVVSTDKGLCGSLNSNLFRVIVREIKAWENAGVTVNFCTIGHKAEQFLKRFGGRIIASTQRSQMKFQQSLESKISTMRTLIELYERKELDHVYVMYNKFVNAVQQIPTLLQLLPIERPINIQKTRESLYEPGVDEVLQLLLDQFLDSRMYQSLLENHASEQAARRLAMQNATDNAEEMIMDLQLIYNKARQASITRELSEIVAGAAAISSS